MADGHVANTRRIPHSCGWNDTHTPVYAALRLKRPYLVEVSV